MAKIVIDDSVVNENESATDEIISLYLDLIKYKIFKNKAIIIRLNLSTNKISLESFNSVEQAIIYLDEFNKSLGTEEDINNISLFTNFLIPNYKYYYNLLNPCFFRL